MLKSNVSSFMFQKLLVLLSRFFVCLCVTTAYKLAFCPPSRFLQVLNNVLHEGHGHRHQYGVCSPVFRTELTPDNLLALCPWDMVADYDEHRHPHAILVARCRCKTCLQNYKCKPVYTQREVKQYQCVNGTMMWTNSLQYFPNSCVCVRATRQHATIR